MAKNNISLKLPVGTLVWPHLLVPDEYKGVESYKCNLKVPLEEGQPIIDKIQAMIEKEKKKDALNLDDDNIEYEDIYVPYTIDEEGGFVEFKTKLNRFGKTGKRQFENSVDVFDASNPPKHVPKDTDIMTGSRGSLFVNAYRWGQGKDGKLGISLRLRAAQVIEICTEVTNSAESYGFGAVDGGYDVDTEESHGDVDAEAREAY